MDQDVSAKLSRFVLEEFLPGEDPSTLKPDTKLISTGIVTSLGLVRLASFVEKTYGIRLGPDEISERNFETIELMTDLVNRHRANKRT
jgi:acyl carrier protein